MRAPPSSSRDQLVWDILVKRRAWERSGALPRFIPRFVIAISSIIWWYVPFTLNIIQNQQKYQIIHTTHCLAIFQLILKVPCARNSSGFRYMLIQPCWYFYSNPAYANGCQRVLECVQDKKVYHRNGTVIANTVRTILGV
jgi:hypothetical protein